MIDENRIKSNHQEFSFPRQFGTESEKVAFNKIKQKIEGLGLKTETQSFEFSGFYSTILFKIYLLLFACYFILEFFNSPDYVMFPAFSVLLVSWLILFIYSRNPENIKLGKKMKSQNLLVKISPKKVNNENKEKDKNIVFICHIDSKGQLYSITKRVLTYYFWIGSFVLLIFTYFLRFIYYEQLFWFFHIIATIILIINIISSLLLIANTSNDKSNGAIDNASGISIVLELLHHFLDDSSHPKEYNFWFLFTGAEECGTMGMRNFLNNLKDEKKSNYVLINFDAIGTEFDLIKFGIKNYNSLEFSELFIESARELEYKIKTRRVIIGVHTDAWVGSKRGFRVLEFGDRKSYKYLHSTNDTIDKVDYGILEKMCLIISATIKEIDNKRLILYQKNNS